MVVMCVLDVVRSVVVLDSLLDWDGEDVCCELWILMVFFDEMIGDLIEFCE